jgi:hypothetical protein
MGFYPNKLTRKLSTWFGRTDTIDSQDKRMTKAEAVLTSFDGSELAHAWATFLALKYPGNIQS